MKNRTVPVWGVLWGMWSLAITAFAADPTTLPSDDRQTRTWIDAASQGDLPRLKQAFESGTGVDRSFTNRETALHFAAYNGRAEVVNWLLSKKAEVNATNEFGQTPLHLVACWSPPGGKTIAAALVGAGASVNKVDGPDGLSPLHYAVLGIVNSVDHELLKFLVQNGADPGIRSKSGETPIQIAYTLNDWESLQLLSNAVSKDPRRAVCQARLRFLGLATLIWAMDHDYQMPRILALICNYISRVALDVNRTVPYCPNSREGIPTPYVFVNSVRVWGGHEAYLLCPVHGLVLFADGSVDYPIPASPRP